MSLVDKNKIIEAFCDDTSAGGDTGNGDTGNGDTGTSDGGGSTGVEEISGDVASITMTNLSQANTEEVYVLQDLIDEDGLKDILRKETGNTWKYSGEENEIDVQELTVVNTSNLEIGDVERQQDTTTIKQSIQIDDPNPSLFDKEYGDIVLFHNRPSAVQIDSIRNSFSIRTKKQYNFYYQKYENKNVPTTGIPNYYILNESGNSEDEYENQDIVSYMDTIQEPNINEKYVKKYSDTAIPQSAMTKVSTKLQNIIFPYHKMGSYLEHNNSTTKEEIFPFYVGLEFEKDISNNIFRALREDNALDYFLSYIVYRENNQDFETLTFSIDGNSRPLRKRQEISVMKIDNDFDIEHEIQSDKVCFVNDIEEADLTNFFFEDSKIKKEYTRTYQDMLDGKTGYSETLFYKINKYEMDGITTNQIQSFYIPNVEETSKFTMLDSQVKYGKKYRYEVYAYKYVLGNSYKYKKQNGKIVVENTPVSYIAKMLFAINEETLLDNPPAPPEVEVVPYKDNAENISFFFNPSALQYKLKDYAFSEQDRLQYKSLRESQNVSEDEYLTFGSDDLTTKYYIYRLEHHPYSFMDFKDKLHNILDVEDGAVTAQLLETVEPNKKYYYIFRAVDVHGHLSPPTEVLELESIFEDGTVFLHTKYVPFKENKFQKRQKNAKKYIHIKPSLIQSIIDESALEIRDGEEDSAKSVIDRVSLGNSDLVEQSVWDKKFKLRVKSKNTNKFVDIKFKFSLKKEENSWFFWKLTNKELFILVLRIYYKGRKKYGISW